MRPDRGVLLSLGTAVLVAGLAAAAAQGPAYAAVALVVAAYIVVLATIGARTTGVVLLLLAFATAPMYRGLEGLTGGTIPPTDVLLVGGLVHLLPGLLQNKLRVPTLYLVGLLLMAVFSLVSVIVTGNLFTNAFYAIQWLFYVGGLPLLVAWWQPHRTTVVWLLWAYLAGHLVSTARGLAEGATFANRYDGLTHHPNAFGVAGVTSIAIGLFLFHHHKSVLARTILVGVAGIGLFSITLSGSRAAIVVLVVLVLLVPLVERSALAGVGLAFAVAFGLLSLPFLVQASDEESAIGRLAGGGTASGSDRVRTQALEDGLARLGESPILGSGFDDIEQIHNVFLEAAVAIGVLGLLSYLLVMFVLARPLFSQHPLRRLCYPVWVFLGVAPTFPGLWDRTMWVPASLAILATVGAAAPEPETATAPTQLSPGRA